MILIMHKCLEMMVVNRHGDDVVHEFGKDVDWSDRCRRRGIRFSKTTENCLPFSLVAVYSIIGQLMDRLLPAVIADVPIRRGGRGRRRRVGWKLILIGSF